MKKSNEESSRRNFQLPWQPQRKRNSATTETDLKKQHSGSDIGPETFIVREAVKLQFVTQLQWNNSWAVILDNKVRRTTANSWSEMNGHWQQSNESWSEMNVILDMKQSRSLYFWQNGAVRNKFRQSKCPPTEKRKINKLPEWAWKQYDSQSQEAKLAPLHSPPPPINLHLN